MNLDQFNEACALENIMGQFVSLVTVTDQKDNVKKEFKDLGVRKISRFQVHIRKKHYIELLNTSTGAAEMGIEFKPKRDSFYNHEAHEGFFCNLKSNPDKKYIEIRWNENDKEIDDSVLIDKDNNILKDDVLKDSARSPRTVLAEQLGVYIRQFKIESIALMRIAGKEFIDDKLKDYLTEDRIKGMK